MSGLTTLDLHEQLSQRYAGNDAINVELLDSLEPAINVLLRDFGDMQVQVAASGEQIFVSTVLAPASRVKDRNGFNDACLRINPVNPLSNLGLITSGNDDLYIVFGELSSKSSIDMVDEEIQTLAANTLDAVEALAPYLT